MSKWHRVAVSGKTADGRVITKEEIADMAETYDAEVYTARIWPEHYRFMPLGEVTEVKAEPFKIKGEEELALYVRYEANASYDYFKKYGEKIHGSVEIRNNMPRMNGKSYLSGLGVTDSPASFGTEKLYALNQFNNKYQDVQADNITPFIEMATLEEEPIDNSSNSDESGVKNFTAVMMETFEAFAAKFSKKDEENTTQNYFTKEETTKLFTDNLQTLLEKVGEHFSQETETLTEQVKELKSELDELNQTFTKLKETPEITLEDDGLIFGEGEADRYVS